MIFASTWTPASPRAEWTTTSRTPSGTTSTCARSPSPPGTLSCSGTFPSFRHTLSEFNLNLSYSPEKYNIPPFHLQSSVSKDEATHRKKKLSKIRFISIKQLKYFISCYFRRFNWGKMEVIKSIWPLSKANKYCICFLAAFYEMLSCRLSLFNSFWRAQLMKSYGLKVLTLCWLIRQAEYCCCNWDRRKSNDFNETCETIQKPTMAWLLHHI